MDWTFTETDTPGGIFRVFFTRHGRGGVRTEVTNFRDVPAQLEEFTDADPFGDATGRMSFPQITVFDDLKASEIGSWLAPYADVDVYWVPAVTHDPVLYPQWEAQQIINPVTGARDLIAPLWITLPDGHGGRKSGPRNSFKVFEGFVADFGFTADEQGSQLSVDLQGAVFQVDRYLAKPFFPLQPWPLELLITEVFKHDRRPHLRTRPLAMRFPKAWHLKVPAYAPGTNTVVMTAAKPGTLWSGYTSRDTGGWDHALTGYVQTQLSNMITDKRSGVSTGNNWTIRHYRAGETLAAGKSRAGVAMPAYVSGIGRLPVLEIRDRRRKADIAVWAGQPGVTLDVHSDSTQSGNVVYGEGTGVDGTGWRNAVVGTSRTDYLPLAWSPEVWPVTKDNKAFVPESFTSEVFTRYGTGFDLPDAVTVAQQTLARDQDPGWTGTITLKVDPSPTRSRWLIKAGWTIKVKGFAGSGATGVNFHIASTTKRPLDGSIELTVDTRYRDLATVEEAKERTRDPMTPIRLLQVGKASVEIEDIEAPWDYRAGSGFVPHPSVHYYDHKPVSQTFPYDAWTRQHPPLHYKSNYVRVLANAADSRKRWTGPVPVRMSERGVIARAEFRACDVLGRRLKVPYHVSLYYFNGTAITNMPLHNGIYSPFNDNAFEETDGNGMENFSNLKPPDGMIVGWGNKQRGVMNAAGFWPGRQTDNDPATGLLVDESQIQFDLTQYHNYYKGAPQPGRKPTASDVEIYAMFYCEYTEPVYFQGRLFRLNPGAR